MNNMENEFKILLLEASKLYELRNYDEALNKINKALSLKKNSVHARNLKAGILIESWNGKQNTKNRILEAKVHLEMCIDAEPNNKAIYAGNLGNLFYKLAISELSIEKSLNKAIVDEFLKAKEQYNISLEICEEQPDIFINKGNTLDNLGRYFEALHCYDKAIILDNEHYNAWGCRGICCWRLSNLVENDDDKSILFLNAMLCFAIELEQNPSFEIDDSSKKYVNANIQQNKAELDRLKKQLKKQLQDKQKIIDSQFNLYTPIDSSFQEFYFDFCEKHGLFLNTHFDCNKCGHSTLDLIEASFVTNSNDYKSPYEFFKRWYSMLDDYKTSRFYLSLSQYKHSDFLFLDKLRYEPDYSLNYLPNAELLKTAFQSAINIYDKVAFFLNNYEELGNKDSQVSFWGGNCIFYQTNIMDKNNWDIHLVALYTILIDLSKNELTKLVNMRNSLVHKYLVLHDIIDVESLTYPYSNDETLLQNPEYHIDIHEFYQYTIHAIRQLKTVLYALSFFIAKKEKAKEKEANGKIGKLEWTHNWDVDDELTKAANNLENDLKNIYSNALDSFLENLDIPDNEKN